MVIFFLSIIFIFILLEILFFILVNYLRIRIPWVITNKDEYPIFNEKKIETFLKKTYNFYLGWNWKPNSIHIEKSYNKKNKIYFGKYGERKGLASSKKKINHASFGDSFVFCRFVKNNQTWQEQISKMNHFKILNFGVGNYGLDQIYLKYLNTELSKKIKTVYIGFVPETLSRCLCSWKHYHEFNNIYGFKPKFFLHKNKPKLINNPIVNTKSFQNIYKIINTLKKKEFFYKEKFRKYKLEFPFTFNIFLNPIYNVNLLFYSILKILCINENKIYEFIIKRNCLSNDIYFRKKNNKILIKKLMLKIKKLSQRRNHKVFFIIFPQKYDLMISKKNYQKFFSKLKKDFNIIDLTKIFETNNLNDIYLPDQYGAHLTPYGNHIVAKTLIKNKFY